MFTKLLRPVVAYWRSNGIRIPVYLDDGIGADRSRSLCFDRTLQVHSDLVGLGFLINEKKSNFEPRQSGEHLGFLLDLAKGVFSIPDKKFDDLFELIQKILTNASNVSARTISRVTGTLISRELALGPIVRLQTRGLYADQNRMNSLSHKLCLSEEAIDDLRFWRDNFCQLVGRPIWRPSPTIVLITYSDASSLGWGGFVVQFGSAVARRIWSESKSLCSSALREIRAIRYVLQSFSHVLEARDCKHRTDNQSVCSILSVGSSKLHLQREAVAMYTLCHEKGIRFSVEWIQRELNSKADYWSKVIDQDDWKLNPIHSRVLDFLWGPHTVVDAFTVSWEGENNWLVPPVYLVPRVIRHMKAGREEGTLVIPFWPSAAWWPLLSPRSGQFYPWVLGWQDIPLHENTFLPGSATADLFGSGIPSSRILAMRLDFQGF